MYGPYSMGHVNMHCMLAAASKMSCEPVKPYHQEELLRSSS